jgi:hypothetical protein
MTCFWTDLVATTQFCEPDVATGTFGLAVQFSDPDTFADRYGATSAPDEPAGFAAAMAALIASPRVTSGLLNSSVGDSPFFVKRANPDLAGYIVATETFFAGINVYDTAAKTVDTPVYLNPTEVYDSGSDTYSLEFDDTVESGSLTVTEAYLAYMQQSATDDFHGIAVASLTLSRFTVGFPTPGTLRVDYTGGAAPLIGAFTLYGSADSSAVNIISTGYVVSIVRVSGTVTTGASGSIAVDCYLTGFRNGNI